MRCPQGRVFWCLMLVLSTWGQLTVAQPPQPASELQQLIARSKLVVALVDTDYPPLVVTSQTGQLQGHNIALVQDIARELGVQVEFVRTTTSFNEIVDMVSRGEADIGLTTSITLARAHNVLFTQPYLTLKMALLLNRRKLIEQGLGQLHPRGFCCQCAKGIDWRLKMYTIKRAILRSWLQVR